MMKRGICHIGLGSLVIVTALGAGAVVQKGRVAQKPKSSACGATVLPDVPLPTGPAARIAKNYGNGVCLIVGTYSFTGPNGRPLRYVSPASNGLPAFEDEDTLNVSFSGTGDVFRQEFTYTGFVVEDGKILTTRRAAEPWLGDPDDKRILDFGGKPQLEPLTAYFPTSKAPFTLIIDRVSTESDLALCRFAPDGKDFPVLPFETAPLGGVAIMLGFPTGVDGLIARGQTPKAHFETLSSIEEQASELAASGRLLPQVGQGSLSRETEQWIAQGVPTTESGLGSPVFGHLGTVVGVCSAPRGPAGEPVHGMNLVVPIQKVRKFLNEKPAKTTFVIEPSRKR